MIYKTGVVFLWFLTVPILIFAGFSQLSTSKKSAELSSINNNVPISISPISDSEENELEGEVLGIQIDDMRSIFVANFLEGTPLEDYASLIVETSDKYGVDWRLIPAIAMKETGGGVAVRSGSHNAWGFENGRTNFDSWEGAIETVAKTLKERYIAKGLTTPEEIMPVYAPPQVENGGIWAQQINDYFEKLETL